MKLLEIDLPPFLKLAWVSKEVKDEYENKLELAKNAYNNLELETLLHGKRKCMTMHVGPTNLIKTMDDLTEKGLYYLPIKKVAAYSGFAHKHPNPIDGNWKWYGVVAKNIEDARLFKKYEENRNHRELGKLLGYPECCIDFFEDKWTKGYFDPIWQQAENTSDEYKIINESNLIKINHELPFENNVMLRYLGVRLIPHIPCSLDCKETHKRAKEWLELGKELELEGINELEKFLRLPVEWDALKGIAYVSTPLFKIETNSMTCYPKYVVQKMGTFYPKYLPRGLKFPYRMEQSIPKEIMMKL